jgi:hypothetical protein
VSDADFITPATKEQIARQVADAKKFNGNASLWDIETRRVVRTLANDRIRLTEQVKLLREAAAKVLDDNCGDPWGLLDEGDQPRGGLDALKVALEATKEEA